MPWARWASSREPLTEPYKRFRAPSTPALICWRLAATSVGASLPVVVQPVATAVVATASPVAEIQT